MLLHCVSFAFSEKMYYLPQFTQHVSGSTSLVMAGLGMTLLTKLMTHLCIGLKLGA